MKKVLLGSAAALLIGVGAYALDDDRHQTRIHLAHGSQIQLGDGEGTIVEIRGADGDRTVHISNSGDESILEINGQVIEIDDGMVVIDGEEIVSGRGSFVIVDGDEIRVVDGDVQTSFNARHMAHIAERAEHAARLGEHISRDVIIDLDLAGLEEDIMSTLHEIFNDLPEDLEGAYYDGGRSWDDLSDEEREEVREAMNEAREEIREAMADVRIELRDAARDIEHERRVHIHVEREMEIAEREMARAEREIERAERELERADRHREYRFEMRREFYEHEDMPAGDVETLRIETDDAGRRRVWVNGEEQVGDDLTDWLNRLESGRLEGGR